MLRTHAAERPNQPAFTYMADGQADQTLNYGQLDLRARAIAGRLQELDLVGQRVLLAFPPGLDFLAGFFGCLYAGCVAVPTFLPHRRTFDRFHAIAKDSGASLCLTTSDATPRHVPLHPSAPSSVDRSASIPTLAIDQLADSHAQNWRPQQTASHSLAMLQYTSGSTSEPKGVMLSHANLCHGTRAIFEAFSMRSDIGVFWLPTSHDMGLVGGVLVPVLAGVHCLLMAPVAFLRQPLAWLTAISTHRGTISGAPNFAYDLCVRRTTPQQRASLDLSSWELAFVGAEPTRPETLERFADAFAPCGFNPRAFYPCYGLAEATLMVTGGDRGAGSVVRAFDETALTRHSVHARPEAAPGARRIVSCGSPVAGSRVVIVDEKTLNAAPPESVGEVWVAGPAVGMGYWNKPELTRRCFGASLSDTGEGPFLRTGDLGFIFEGTLCVIGRADDLLIVRGLNHHPHDIESTVRASHPLLEPGLGAAFSIADASDQRLVLVHEVTRNGTEDLSLVLETARRAVLEEHDLAPFALLLVRTGTIPTTSSGKVQRRACRAAYLAGTLRVVAEFQRPAPLAKMHGPEAPAPAPVPAPANPIATAQPPVRSLRAAPAPTEADLIEIVCRHAESLTGSMLLSRAPQTPLAALGLDSLQRVELAAALETKLSIHLPDSGLNPVHTLGELAQAVQTELRRDLPRNPDQKGPPPCTCDISLFPEYLDFKRTEQLITSIVGSNPYFNADPGGPCAPGTTCLHGRDFLTFGVYDYLGMARDQRVIGAAKAAIDRYGPSAGASRLVAGDKQIHHELEHALAQFLGTEAALVFVSGHATNVTVIGHLFGPEDLILHDALAHNSIIQGAKLSGATRRAFPHNDWRALDAHLQDIRHRFRRVLIAIEGVYSMDGDFPDLPRFVALKHKHKALLLVDEAHSLGTMGPTGRGIAEYWRTPRHDVDLWMGTLSKALASCGGYIAGSSALLHYLSYTAPGFVYSVGLPPSSAAAALAALNLLTAEPHRVLRLRHLSTLFLDLARQRGLNTGSAAATPVVPVIVGSSKTSLQLARALFDRDIQVHPILPPAIPESAARLRFFITTNHSEQQIRDTVTATADELARLQP